MFDLLTFIVNTLFLSVLTCCTGSCDAWDKPSCASGHRDCDRKESNGCETDINGDVMNCGGCGAVCEERTGFLTTCNKGKCEYTDKCVVTNCLVEPNASSTCKLGRCKSICNAGYADCNNRKIKDGCETFVGGSDVMNCGSCGAVCKERPGFFTTCKRGKCEYQDRCVAIKCATYPNSSTICTAGKCMVTCLPGYGDCNNDLQKDGCEVVLQSDILNCGKCGHKCLKPLRNSGTEAICR